MTNPANPHGSDPCDVCGWNYDIRKERRGVYSKVSPLFYYPAREVVRGHAVYGVECRWCSARVGAHLDFAP